MVKGAGNGGDDEDQGEEQGEGLVEPLQVAEEVMEALGWGQVVVGPREEEAAGVQAQDLHATQRPPEALLLEPSEGQRHEAAAVGAVDIDTLQAQGQQAQGSLGVLSDDGMVEAADGIEGRTTDEAHGASEDDGVAAGASHHGDIEEIAVGVIEAAQVGIVRPVAVVLRDLDEGD